MSRVLTALVLALTLALHAGTAAAQAPALGRGPWGLRLYVHGWSAAHAAAIRSAAAELRAAGARIRYATRPGPGVLSVVPWGFGLDGTIGYYDRDGYRVMIDPTRLDAIPEAFRHTALHELMHALGGRHVCRLAGERPDDCVGAGGETGPAVLNPSLRYTVLEIAAGHGRIVRTAVIPHLTALDRAELQRARQAWLHAQDPWAEATLDASAARGGVQ